jgi:tetratricopeptide (TPR) repeat protein
MLYDKAAEALDKAGSLLEELAKESLTEPQYRWELAQAYRWQGQVWPNRKVPQRAEAVQAFRRAAALAEELAAESPSTPDYRMHAATCRVSAGGVLAAMKRTPEAEAEYLKALKLWKKLVQDVPAQRWYRHELAYNLDSLGWLWEAVNQSEKAEPFFRKALAYHEKLVAEDATIDDSPERLARTHQHLAQVLKMMGRLPEAKKARREALTVLEKLDPKDVATLRARAATYRNLGEYDKAIADLNKAVVLDPKHAAAWADRGAAYLTLKLYDRALANLNEAIRLDQEDAVAWHNRGQAYAGLHQYDKALFNLNKAIKLDSKNANFCNHLAWLFATCPDHRFRDAGKAVEFAKEAVRLAPTDGAALNTLGVARYRAGEWMLAVEALNKSMDMSEGGNSFDWFFLAMAHWHLGEKDKARQWYEKAVEWMEKDKPPNDQLRRFRAEAEELLGIEKPGNPEPELVPPPKEAGLG